MANANDILAYLPNSFKTRDEQDYINFLWESYESNYNNGKYPFAFIAFHMLYMSFVYFEVFPLGLYPYRPITKKFYFQKQH